MAVDTQSEQRIFAEALEYNAPEARANYLQEACGDNAELRARVESLLKAFDSAGAFLEGERPSSGADADRPAESSPMEEAGNGIGRYQLLQRLGEGGFGVVYLAEQREPVRRRVALKIIKLGMDTRQVIGRFEAERQVLALMDHPHIAKVLDGGATETGRPYFVMELVPGIPITQYCDEHRLTTEQRLVLFLDVCHAIQHAHQKGIIHRDIKPSNVLITWHDQRPLAKVIDFGVAKATQYDLTDITVFTQVQERVGTPAYMSPEQAQRSGLDIDTRTDIYSLGVLLYELLTGRTPFDTQQLLRGGWEEVWRCIREVDPVKPSARLKTLDTEERREVALQRRASPEKLGKLIHNDLDWIVMKALEKDRGRRYESAGALARDIGHFLKKEPVSAAAPSVLYKFRKFTQRHRTGVITALVLGCLVVLAASVSSYFAIRATRAERLARQGAATAQAVYQFLNDDILAQANPEIQPDREIKLRTLLDRAALRIEERFRAQPLVEAAIRSTVGKTYENLGEFETAEPHLRRAYELWFHEQGERHPQTLAALSDLSMVLLKLRKNQDALELGEKSLAMASVRLGRNDPVTLTLMSRLSWIYYHTGDSAQATALAAEAVAAARNHTGINLESHAIALHVLARMTGREGNVAEGERLLRQSVDLVRAELGDEHPQTLKAKNRLAAYLYDHRIKLDEAEELYRSALEHNRRILGESHPMTSVLHGNLVLLYWAQQRYDLALWHQLKILEFSRTQPDLSDMEALQALWNVAPLKGLAGSRLLPSSEWRMKSSPPLSTWSDPEFDDRTWSTGATVGATESWVRVPFELDAVPRGVPIILIPNRGDYEVYLNGLPARTGPAGKADRFQLFIVDPQARAGLRPGRNILALHARNVSPDEPFTVELYESPAEMILP